MKISDQKILAFLTGYTPLSLRDEKIEEPTANEIKNFVLRLSSQDLQNLSKGPRGQKFLKACNQALAAEAAAMTKNMPPPNGRSASGFVDFNPREVGREAAMGSVRSREALEASRKKI